MLMLREFYRGFPIDAVLEHLFPVSETLGPAHPAQRRQQVPQQKKLAGTRHLSDVNVPPSRPLPRISCPGESS